MKTVNLPIGIACIALSACATSPPQLEFSKAGVPQSQVEADAADCWNYALNSPAGRQNADMVNGSRILGGGVFAAANMAAEKSASNNDPKKDLGNWDSHKNCMTQKGYSVKLAG